MKLPLKSILITISIIFLFTIVIVQFFKKENHYKSKNHSQSNKIYQSNNECPDCNGNDCIQLTPVKHNFVVSYLGKRTSDRGYVYADISWYSDYKDGYKLQTPIEQNYPYTFYYTFPCQPLTFGNLRSCYKVDVSMSEFPTREQFMFPIMLRI